MKHRHHLVAPTAKMWVHPTLAAFHLLKRILLHLHQYRSYQSNHKVVVCHHNHIFSLVVNFYSSVQKFKSDSQVCELYSMYHHYITITNIRPFLILLHHNQYRLCQSNQLVKLYHRNQKFILVVHSYFSVQ